MGGVGVCCLRLLLLCLQKNKSMAVPRVNSDTHLCTVVESDGKRCQKRARKNDSFVSLYDNLPLVPDTLLVSCAEDQDAVCRVGNNDRDTLSVRNAWGHSPIMLMVHEQSTFEQLVRVCDRWLRVVIANADMLHSGAMSLTVINRSDFGGPAVVSQFVASCVNALVEKQVLQVTLDTDGLIWYVFGGRATGNSLPVLIVIIILTITHTCVSIPVALAPCIVRGLLGSSVTIADIEKYANCLSKMHVSSAAELDDRRTFALQLVRPDLICRGQQVLRQVFKVEALRGLLNEVPQWAGRPTERRLSVGGLLGQLVWKVGHGEFAGLIDNADYVAPKDLALVSPFISTFTKVVSQLAHDWPRPLEFVEEFLVYLTGSPIWQPTNKDDELVVVLCKWPVTELLHATPRVMACMSTMILPLINEFETTTFEQRLREALLSMVARNPQFTMP